MGKALRSKNPRPPSRVLDWPAAERWTLVTAVIKASTLEGAEPVEKTQVAARDAGSPLVQAQILF